jgi:hypothetical protein
MKKDVSIQNEGDFMSFDEKCKCKPGWVCPCHEKFDEEKVFLSLEKCVSSRIEVVK